MVSYRLKKVPMSIKWLSSCESPWSPIVRTSRSHGNWCIWVWSMRSHFSMIYRSYRIMPAVIGHWRLIGWTMIHIGGIPSSGAIWKAWTRVWRGWKPPAVIMRGYVHSIMITMKILSVCTVDKMKPARIRGRRNIPTRLI